MVFVHMGAEVKGHQENHPIAKFMSIKVFVVLLPNVGYCVYMTNPSR